MSEHPILFSDAGVNHEALAEATKARAQRIHDDAWARDALPRVLPATWRVLRETLDGAMYERNGLRVIVSGATEQDGRRWLHVSCSRPTRLPDWDDLKLVKELFIGPGRQAIQVFPPRERYVNINSNVLHLWCCLDGDGIPDFTNGTGSI
jgi:hypothetical protein